MRAEQDWVRVQTLLGGSSRTPFWLQPQPLLFDKATHLVFDALRKRRRETHRCHHRDDLPVRVGVVEISPGMRLGFGCRIHLPETEPVAG